MSWSHEASRGACLKSGVEGAVGVRAVWNTAGPKGWGCRSLCLQAGGGGLRS